ncbi:MAG: Ubiquinone/menaquinone biosynthesis methyltransferase [Pseudomonadota bacterium]|jgi:demethylmenaquinone methyltransferase/2-methoxy-6-polyprenyl-1,4-benzoquinol methylase
MTAQPKLQASARLGSGAMFDAIAPRYDLLNRLISLGIDQSWRRKTVASLQLSPGDRALDLATGTADLAILVARRTGASVVGLDPSTGMMKVGEEKIQRLGLSEQVKLVEGDAQELPFGDGGFAGICMAFGIRNVPDRSRALREMARVTRSGGRIAILELSEPRAGWLGAAARFHMHRVVPWLGGLLSGSREYRYLPESIQRFPSPEAFCSLMSEAGLRDVRALPLTFGVCQLFTAEVP